MIRLQLLSNVRNLIFYKDLELSDLDQVSDFDYNLDLIGISILTSNNSIA